MNRGVVALLFMVLLLLPALGWAAVAHVTADWDGQNGSDTMHVYNTGLSMSAGHTVPLMVWSDVVAQVNATATVADNCGGSNSYTQADQQDEPGADARGVTFYGRIATVTGCSSSNYTITVERGSRARAVDPDHPAADRAALT